MGFRGEMTSLPQIQPDIPSRRRFLVGTAAVVGSWAGQNTEQLVDVTSQTVTAAEFLYYLKTDPAFHDFIYPPEIAPLLASQERTLYTHDAIQKTRIITFGDSLAVGTVEDGTDFPPAWHMARKMNHYVGKNNWTWQNEAWNGATTADVRKQIAKIKLADTTPVDTDILLSVGSNDLLQEQDIVSQFDLLRQNPTNISALRTLAHSFDTYLHTYQQNLQSILQDIQTFAEDQDVLLNRVIVSGSPNIENAKHITLPNGQILPMTGMTKEFAARCSSLINLSMAKVTIETNGHTPFAIRFIDNRNLEPEEFSGMHPNKAGYTKMVDNQMKQSVVTIPNNQVMTLDDLTAISSRSLT